ncbi:Protein NRT1/ PTR FAMILY 1.2 [Linum perenne]
MEEDNRRSLADEEDETMALTPKKGGFRTMPFIILSEALHSLANTGLNANMVIYLTKELLMEAVTASSIISLWSAASSFLSVGGAVLSDSLLGRFTVIIIGSFFTLLGTTGLWSTAMVSQLRPPHCNQSSNSCDTPATATQLAILYTSLGLISLGSGCLVPSIVAFGADQLDHKDKPNNERVLQRFFSWYYAIAGLSILLGVTVVVYIQDSYGWKIGLAVPTFLVLFSTLFFLLPSSIYVKHKARGSLLVGCFRVLVAAIRKQGSKTDINSDDGTAQNPWTLCTVEEVEAVKSIVKVLPIWSTGFLFYLSLAQTPFMTLQAQIMNRHIFSTSFQIPPGSLNSFLLISYSLSLVIYDSILVPILSKFTGIPRGLSTNVRLGAGMVLSISAMAISGAVESTRKWNASNQDSMEMSVLWLVPSLLLLGMSQTLNSMEQLAFYYSQLPKAMSSIAVCIFTLVAAIGSLLSSVLIDAVDRFTSGGGKVSWLSSNLNEGHLDYYYWLIAGICSANFVYFLLFCRTSN